MLKQLKTNYIIYFLSSVASLWTSQLLNAKCDFVTPLT